MLSTLQLQSRFTKLNACVVLPTYNNCNSLQAVIDSILQYTNRIIIVNDGSTDTTSSILKAYPDLEVIHYQPNAGKGYALRKGLKAADKMGYAYAITLDSDGQHYASDLVLFLDAIEHDPNALLIGARNMQVDHVPVKSSFGNRFSNFWYWVNTGIRLPDTQSGYRLYPVAPLAALQYFSRKYEFEIEVIVRAAWKGIPVKAIPVSVYYPPAGERVSHFRPFKDFTRISIMNTVLVTIALLWIKPRDFIRTLFSREGWRRIGRSFFLHPDESNIRKAASIGFGVFMGILPIWGFQLLIGIPLALLFRLNKALFLLAANISIFPFTAFWLVASLAIGKFLQGDPNWSLQTRNVSLSSVHHAGIAFFLGGTVLAVVLGLLALCITYLWLLIFRKTKQEPNI